MDPKKVNPKKFTVYEILYQDDNFAISWGEWTDSEEMCIAMRWNGEDKHVGFPQSRGNPMWFLIPNENSISKDLLRGIISNPHSKESKIKAILREL